MNNFMIGMHGIYDYKKFHRDYRNSFYGVQACLFENEKDIETLKIEAENRNFKIGIHFPLRAGLSELRDPLFLSLNEDIRREAFKHIEDELKYINDKQLKTEYILFHYPKPAILKEAFDLKNWRFYSRSEYTYEAEYPYDEFKENSEELFKWLSEKSLEYNFIPVLELDALNKYVYKSNFLEDLLKKYTRVKLCLDTGRIHIQHKIDSEINDINILKKYVKYTEVIHLWNVKIGDKTEGGHFPALPGLKTEDGWAPIKEYFRIIKQENKNVKIMFEHRSELISDEELESCYEWISFMLE